MKKILLLCILAIALLLVGCGSNDDHENVEEVPKPTFSEKKAKASITIEKPGAVPDAKPAIKEFTLTAKQWEFSQKELRVSEGDKVKITITSDDVTHGISLPAFGVSKRLTPGDEQVIEFTADKAGEHSFFCNVPCGSGHRSMKGTLIVE